ncbi:MAG: hypothetical protein JKX99_10075 [Robiginitomaculum sp.]|nr:hypothetical protein [Robiginitomaculum sp.]
MNEEEATKLLEAGVRQYRDNIYGNLIMGYDAPETIAVVAKLLSGEPGCNHCWLPNDNGLTDTCHKCGEGRA